MGAEEAISLVICIYPALEVCRAKDLASWKARPNVKTRGQMQLSKCIPRILWVSRTLTRVGGSYHRKNHPPSFSMLARHGFLYRRTA